MNSATQPINNTNKTVLGKVRNYGQIVTLLDSLRPYSYDQDVLDRMQKLNLLLGNVVEGMDIVLVGGTNGKSLTMNFASKILKSEGFKVGVSYSSHFLNYNERTVINDVFISNKDFTVTLNQVIDVAIDNKIDATSFEVSTIASLLYLKNSDVDIVLLEVGIGGKFDATNFCNPVISVLTRIAKDHITILGDDLDETTKDMLAIARKGYHFVSAEQSKLRLKKMKEIVEAGGAKWVMPIRKLASLPYIYEQLYGRTASLGEKIAQIYVEELKGQFSPFLKGNLLAKEKGQRGRPTLEAKRQAKINPIKSLKTFWMENFALLRGRFELLDKEKPSILLENAHNVDAFTNLFLGIRLLNYQKPLKGFALVIGLSKSVDEIEALKAIRYLMRKVNGNVFFVPLSDQASIDVKELEQKSKQYELKAKAFNNFQDAFEAAKTVVDEREGLLCVTGSAGIVSDYWKMRGIKKI